MMKLPVVGGPERFDPTMMTELAVNGDVGAHAARKFGRVGPVRV